MMIAVLAQAVSNLPPSWPSPSSVKRRLAFSSKHGEQDTDEEHEGRSQRSVDDDVAVL